MAITEKTTVIIATKLELVRDHHAIFAAICIVQDPEKAVITSQAPDTASLIQSLAIALFHRRTGSYSSTGPTTASR